jgi:hypothetical protein
MKLLVAFVLLLALVGSVSAWTIESPQVTGEVTFNNDGTGVANVNGYMPIGFYWEHISGVNYEAHYLWYTIPFNYEGGYIVSPMVKNARLVR